MKMFEIASSEFSNQDVSLDHLYQVQKARTQEFWVYLNFLNRKYNFESWSPDSYSALLAPVEQLTNDTSEVFSRFTLLPDLKEKNVSQIDIHRYKSKVKRIVAAKKAYEEAGGKYE